MRMPPPLPRSDSDWMDLLDLLKGELPQPSETSLANRIGLSRSMLSQCRAQDRPLPTPAKLRLLHELGHPLSLEMLIACLPDDARDAICEISAKHQEAAAPTPKAPLRSSVKPSDWIGQIHELADVYGVSLRQLADKLDISHAYLGKVARGEKPASASLKIKLWAAQGSTLDRVTMLELLLPDDVAAEFREFEKSLGTITANSGLIA